MVCFIIQVCDWGTKGGVETGYNWIDRHSCYYVNYMVCFIIQVCDWGTKGGVETMAKTG